MRTALLIAVLTAWPAGPSFGAVLPAAKVRASVLEALRGQLDGLPGAVQDIRVRGLKALPMPGAAAEVRIGFRADEDFAGKVPVRVEIMDGDRVFHQAWVTANVGRTVPVVRAARRLERGHVVAPDDVKVSQVDASRAPHAALADPAAAVGMGVRAAIARGRPFTRAGLVAPDLVARGDAVTLVAGHGALRVTAPGVALQAGARNAFVRARNLATKKVVWARAVGGRTLLVGAEP